MRVYELLFWKFLRFVHPRCTFESLSLPACHLGQFPSLWSNRFLAAAALGRASDFRGWPSVVGFPSRARKSFFEEIVKGFHLLQAPILPRPHFAQVTTQIHKPQIALVYPLLVPSEDLSQAGRVCSRQDRRSGGISGRRSIHKFVKPVEGTCSPVFELSSQQSVAGC